MSDDFDPTDIAANDQRDADRKEAAKQIVEQEIEDLKWLMSDKRGRRIMWQLLAFTGVFRQPFTGDAENTIFRCGMMNVGQKYIGDINDHAPERYNQMVTEKLK